MTNYWNLSRDEQKKLDDLGIDYDLRACLEYNSQPTFDVFDIEKVLAVWEGEKDERDWYWIIEVSKECAKKNDGNKFVYLQGGCDYTGWDCQSWATSIFSKTALKAVQYVYGKELPLTGNTPADAGLGHMLNLLSGSYAENANDIYNNLVKQIKESKKTTWRESKDIELDTKDLPFIK